MKKSKEINCRKSQKSKQINWQKIKKSKEIMSGNARAGKK